MDGVRALALGRPRLTRAVTPIGRDLVPGGAGPGLGWAAGRDKTRPCAERVGVRCEYRNDLGLGGLGRRRVIGGFDRGAAGSPFPRSRRAGSSSSGPRRRPSEVPGRPGGWSSWRPCPLRGGVVGAARWAGRER